MDDATRRLREQAMQRLEDMGESWQGESVNDMLARALIGSTRIMTEAMIQSADFPQKEINPIISKLAIRAFNQQVKYLNTLDEIGKLRGL
jgi:hypothetical protein